MGKYKTYHSVVSDPLTNFVDAICGGTSTKKTVMVDKDTGKRSESYGNSYEETDRKAWEKLHKK